jgi:hypothetical protein
MAGKSMSVWQLAKILFRTLWRAIRQLFHEITGALFATFAIGGVFSVLRQWQNRSVVVPWMMALTCTYTAVMAVFAWMAFRSAKNVR